MRESKTTIPLILSIRSSFKALGREAGYEKTLSFRLESADDGVRGSLQSTDALDAGIDRALGGAQTGRNQDPPGTFSPRRTTSL